MEIRQIVRLSEMSGYCGFLCFLTLERLKLRNQMKRDMRCESFHEDHTKKEVARYAEDLATVLKEIDREIQLMKTFLNHNQGFRF